LSFEQYAALYYGVAMHICQGACNMMIRSIIGIRPSGFIAQGIKETSSWNLHLDKIIINWIISPHV